MQLRPAFLPQLRHRRRPQRNAVRAVHRLPQRQNDSEGGSTVIDPNMLLRNFRNAIDSGHYNVALLAMITLDKQLSIGDELPDEWKR